jgi:hypothetical protein
MLMRVVKARWLVAPFAALILLFSAGAAAAPECHIEPTAETVNPAALHQNHSAIPHDHSAQVAHSSFAMPQDVIGSLGGTLSNEICVVVGFIVLLLLRFSRLLQSNLNVMKISAPEYLLPTFISKNLGYLNLTHLKLGIIRI